MKKLVILLILLALLPAGVAHTQGFKIGIMEAQNGEAAKYKPLQAYFSEKGLSIELVEFKNYTDAANKFATGEIDAMFAGSGVAGSMIIKDVAYPLVRAEHKAGWTTYWAVIIAPKGAPQYTGDPAYFKGRKILTCALASSGEFYARSILDNPTLIEAASHGEAVKALAAGKGDVAIVKNRVWDAIKDQYPGLVQVGQDTGENPDGTLIVSKKLAITTTVKIKNLLLALETDQSAAAIAVKDKMQIDGFIVTTKEDFSHNLELLQKAGVTKAFDFTF